MDILVTNDDGIHSEGIFALSQALQSLGNVVIVAPDTERSAVGHGITVTQPLRVKTIRKNGKLFGYATSGTPADCVKLAVRAILKKKPDMVISGINLGPNAGLSVLASGTLAGAIEGTILGIPSFAVSLRTFVNPDFTIAAEFSKKLAKLIHKNGLPKGTLLNVNVPAVKWRKIKGVKVTRQSQTALVESFDKRVDPHKQIYYWLTGELIDLKGEKDSDARAISGDYISVVPLQCDMTNYGFMDELKRWDFNSSKAL